MTAKAAREEEGKKWKWKECLIKQITTAKRGSKSSAFLAFALEKKNLWVTH